MLVYMFVTPSLVGSSLKIEAAYSSETTVSTYK
jgi:hypothetical protein